MPVELRKRKAPAETPASAPATKKTAAKAPGKKEVKKQPAKKEADASTAAKATTASKRAKAGETIELDGFGGEIETNDGEKTTLKQLLDASKSGVVLLAYPKASTPGCTTQVCLARDAFTQLTSTGLAIYGISRDSPKANTTFKTKQNLPYSLLCDRDGTLITAVGLRKAGPGSGTQRGVFVIDKKGKVLIAQPGGPKDTVEAVKALVDSGKP